MSGYTLQAVLPTTLPQAYSSEEVLLPLLEPTLDIDKLVPCS